MSTNRATQIAIAWAFCGLSMATQAARVPFKEAAAVLSAGGGLSSNTAFINEGTLGQGCGIGSSATSTMLNQAGFVSAYTLYYILVATAGTNGSVDPAGNVLVARGRDQSFRIDANNYYHVSEVQTNGMIALAFGTTNTDFYVFVWSNIVANGRLDALFAPDTTANGTPYYLLAFYYGPSNWEANAMSNRDGDPMLDWEELVAGTDPDDSNDYLYVDAPMATNRGIGIVWPSVPGKRYRISRSSDLIAGFTVIEPNYMATRVLSNFIDNPPEDQRSYIYRIEVPWSPATAGSKR